MDQVLAPNRAEQEAIMRNMTKRHPRRAGFTLLELMIVVVIVGVLAVVAVTSYQRYSFGARNAEAQQFLQNIRMAEFNYFEQFGQFCGTANGTKWPAVVPTAATGAESWMPVPQASPFFQLGIRSTGHVWFQYEVGAGGEGQNGGEAIANSDRPWFWARRPTATLTEMVSIRPSK